MSEEYDEDEDYYPKTLREAVELFLVGDLTDSDEEVIRQCPPHRLDWLHSNFERVIMSSTGLNHGNAELITACCPDNPHATAHDASRVIMEAIRVLFQTGEFPAAPKNDVATNSRVPQKHATFNSNDEGKPHHKDLSKARKHVAEIAVNYVRSNYSEELSNEKLSLALKQVFEEAERIYREQQKTAGKEKQE